MGLIDAERPHFRHTAAERRELSATNDRIARVRHHEAAGVLLEVLKDRGFGPARVEGLPACDWVLIDAGDVIVHVFRPEVRSFYNLETMWGADRPAERLAG